MGTDESTYITYEEQWKAAIDSRSSDVELAALQTNPELLGKIISCKRIMGQIRSGILGISVQRKRLTKKGI